MKTLSGIIALVFTLSLSFLAACHQSEATSVAAPDSGEFCYKAPHGKEYIRLNIKGTEVDGYLINTSENQPLIRDFTGSLKPGSDAETGSELQVTLSHADARVDQTWHLSFEENGLRVKYDVNAREYTSYKTIPCDSIRAVFNRLNETILSYKSTGFRLPKGEPLCYQSVKPAKGSYLLEFFQIWITDGKVKGRGAGYYSGDPVWDFDFHGSLEKNTLKVTVNYRKTGEEPHSVMETWTLDPKEQRIYVKNYPRSVLSTCEYVQAENKDFLNFVHSYFGKAERER